MVDDAVTVPTKHTKEVKPESQPSKKFEQETTTALFEHRKKKKKSLNKLLDSDQEESLHASELTHPCYA